MSPFVSRSSGPGERRWKAGSVAVGLAAVALLAGACSSSSKGASVASTGSGGGGAKPSSTPSANALAFSQCMRQHGIKNFPDPNSNGQIQITNTAPGMDPNSLKPAQEACRHLLPAGSGGQQGADNATALKYSQCMRQHGIKNFPDPNPGGGFQIQGGVDPNSPQFQAAAKACAQYQPGGNGAPTKTINGGQG
jgi:hypothetical protein